MNKKQKELAISFLNERFMIAKHDNRTSDWVYYDGCIHMLETLGFDWKRDKNGKHYIF